VQLLDARHDPTPDDEQMLDFLAELEVPTVVALTKMDKLAPRERASRVTEISLRLGLDPEQVVPFSATTGAGRNELAEAILGLLQQPSWRLARADAAGDGEPDGAPDDDGRGEATDPQP
jgi:GTP-binding protein